ncbi:flippase-like domain-containing protein [Rubinisphaera sp. ICM_H10]|nr:flippase-like domain-containing protein [Rubinisphaera margarita]
MRDVDWTEVGRQFSNARYETIPLYLIALAAFYVLKAIRWKWILLPLKDVPARRAAGPMMIGFMGNNVLPARLGELIRVFMLSRQEKIPAAAVFSSVAIERVLDLLAVLSLVGLGMITVQNLPPVFVERFFYIGLVAIAMVVVLILAVIWIERAVRLARWLIEHLPLGSELKHKLTELVVAAAEGTGVLRRGRLLALLMLNSFVQWSLNCVLILISLWSFGVEVPFPATLILLGVLVFAVTIPTSPGFFGAIQVAFVETLKIFDVSANAAFAASIYYHLLQYVVVTAIGFWYLGRSGFSLERLQDEAEHVDEEIEATA